MLQKCPECGSAKVAEIVYGYPSFDWEKDVDSGKVVLAGAAFLRIRTVGNASPATTNGKGKRSGLAVATLGFWWLFK